jgi:hypothetical protein
LGLSMELLSDDDGFELEETLHHPPLGDVLSDEIDDTDIAAIIAELEPPVLDIADSSDSSAAKEPEVWDDIEPEEK